MKTRTETMIDVSEWDRVVVETYGRPYSFQQQDGCKERGLFRLTVPSEFADTEVSSIPEVINGPEMGVNFDAWANRDPGQPLKGEEDSYSWGIAMWWERNFYPNIQAVANHLHEKGLLDAGDYMIDIDW